MERKHIVVVTLALVLVLASLAMVSIHGATQPTQPSQDEPDLKHWTKYGVVISSADLNATIMEDFVMFYGHDGYVYAFLAAGPSYEFRSIYLVRGSDIYFHNLTVIGKILDDPKAVWEDIRIRPRSVVYDDENGRYLLYYDGMGSQVAFASGVLSCNTSSFPQGPWVESSKNPILVPELHAEGLMVLKKYGTYMGIFFAASGFSFDLCFSNDPLAEFTVIGGIPYRGVHYGQLRGLLKVDGGYLFAFETEYEGIRYNWRVFLGFMDESLRFMGELYNAPVIVPTETYEGTEVANPYLSESSDMILLYYNGHPNGDFSNVVLAYTPKP